MVPGFDNQRQKRIAEQAADWHIRMLEPTSEAEVEAFEAWLAANPEHPKAYAEEVSLAAFSTRLPRRLLAHPGMGSGPARFRPAFGFVVAVALVLAGGLWLAVPAPQAAHAAISNPGPAVRGVKLSDGTTLILDSRTELGLAFERDARAVSLHSGRVRFMVARDADRPFSVTAGQATLTAQNTVFDVTRQGEEVRIWVISGEVALTAAILGQDEASAIALQSGQSVSVRDGRFNEARLEPGSARWPAARLAFDDAPLATIAAVANRRGNPKIALGSGAVGALRVTGVLDIRDTRLLAGKLAAALDLRIEERESDILLKR